MASLIVIFSNDQPKREEKYPRIWLLHKNKDIIEIRIKHSTQPLMNEIDSQNVGSVVYMHQQNK
jgi:hypothetical protein